jgi:pyruvate,water dikinase
VRSSATAEDSAGASFAGTAESYLWVRGADAVAAHVRKCWASLYRPELVSYRQHRGLPAAGLAMAVVVQRMVDARCAGVMFTRSPATGDRSVIAVEAGWGLGSAVVGGEVTPDSFLVSKVTGEIVRRQVAVKTRQHVPAPDGLGVRAAEVPPDQQGQPCLTDAEVRALAQLGRRVEQHYGTAQDIEWAIATGSPPGTGLFLLQSRPETAWAQRTAGPLATAQATPFGHVLDLLSKNQPT